MSKGVHLEQPTLPEASLSRLAGNVPEKILVLGHSNLGDVCYDLVVIQPLRQQFQNAKISFLTSPRAASIAESFKGLDNVIIFDKTASRLSKLRLLMSLASQRFDLTVVLKNTMMHMFLGSRRCWSLRKFLGCRPSEKHMHIADIYLDFLRSHGIRVDKAFFDFDLRSEDDFCDHFLQRNNISPKDKIVGILPMAAWALKNWPAGKWNKLAEELSLRQAVKVIAFGKFSEDLYSRSILNNLSKNIILAGDTTLKQAMALIKRCACFIGPDSSLVHLASCMGVKTVGLYGATSADYIYPYFHRGNLIVSKAHLECMPCYPGGKPCKPEIRFQAGACMEAIDEEGVLRLVKLNL